MWFLDTYVEFLGVVYNLRVLRNIEFFQLVENDSCLNGKTRQIQGKWILELFMGILAIYNLNRC
jgi:hypothetical protein